MCGSEAVCQAAHTHTHKSIRTHTTGRCSELLEEPEVSQFDKESLHINCFITRHLSEAALHPCVCVQSLVYQCVFLLWSCACVCVCVCWMNRVKPACLGNKKPQNKKVLKAFGNNQSRICRAARPSALSSLLPPPVLLFSHHLQLRTASLIISFYHNIWKVTFVRNGQNSNVL